MLATLHEGASTSGGGDGYIPITVQLDRLQRQRALLKYNECFYAAAPSPSSKESSSKSDTSGFNGAAEGGPSKRQCRRNGDDRGPDAAGSAGRCETASGSSEAAGQGGDEGIRNRQRLLVISNRLPVTAVRRADGSWTLDASSGGLVSALVGVKEFELKWIGWAGLNVPDETGQRTLTEALAEKQCFPVFIDEETFRQHYDGYCNKILWPLFHYLGLPREDRLSYSTRSFETQFAAYRRVNQKFADVAVEHYEEGDIVFCHDYHLMFLPKYLKERNPKMKVGWFLHTPFPSSEVHRTLPSRSELLRAVLSADLVGFHTYDYARHFVSACTHILGLEGRPAGVEELGKLTRVAAFPIGIDADRFKESLDLPQVQEIIRDLKQRFSGLKVLLGIERLDMIKGIPQKLLAFEKFLEENSQWREKVVLVQIAIPTRTEVPEYQKLASQVHEIVGRINGRFGTLTTAPITHLDRTMDFHSLCALYAITDVAIVTSLRDGMNLVSYEFVACQESKKGVLILSEFAGAAQSLGAGALLVNPWNISEVADFIARALNMPPDEREKRHQLNYAHVTKHTAQHWADMFVSELTDMVVEAQRWTSSVPQLLPVDTATEQFLLSKNRLLILGFNTTLTKFAESAGRMGDDQIKEMDLKLRPELKEPLTKLCNDPKTTVLVLSGSPVNVLDDNFEGYDMWLAAENGMLLRSAEGEWMTTTTRPESLNMDWDESGVKHVFEYFTERTPRSHIEHRDTSLVWNYKYADIDFGRIQARDMLQHIWTGPISNAAVDVVRGSRSVEVRSYGITKGAAINRILGEIVHRKCMTTPIDYILCIGHFLGKDEDIYTVFDPEPLESVDSAKIKISDNAKSVTDQKGSNKLLGVRHDTKTMTGRAKRLSTCKIQLVKNPAPMCGPESVHESVALLGGSSALDLKPDNYFSCAVGRKHTKARYLLNSSDDVVTLLNSLAWHDNS